MQYQVVVMVVLRVVGLVTQTFELLFNSMLKALLSDGLKVKLFYLMAEHAHNSFL